MNNKVREAFKQGFKKEATTLPGAAATGALPMGDIIFQGATADKGHGLSDALLPAASGAATTVISLLLNRGATSDLIKRLYKAISQGDASLVQRIINSLEDPKAREAAKKLAKDALTTGAAIGTAEGAGAEMANRYRHGEELIRPSDYFGG